VFWGKPKQQGTKSWQALNINGPCAIHFWTINKKITLHIEKLTTTTSSQYESSNYMKIKQKNITCSRKMLIFKCIMNYNFKCNPLVSIWTCYLYNKQASKLKNIKISSFVKELLFLFIIAPWKKTQINPTAYCIYSNKKKSNPNLPLL
jgi:hypothetical protein